MSIGIWQVILILMIVLILFGAGKIPKVMGDLAKGIKNFKAGMQEETEVPERYNQTIKDETTHNVHASPASDKVSVSKEEDTVPR